jgi:hypothetical protein
VILAGGEWVPLAGVREFVENSGVEVRNLSIELDDLLGARTREEGMMVETYRPTLLRILTITMF